MKEFNERLKELRKASGLTQSDLAEKLNVHLQTVSKWERGMFQPDLSQLGDIAAALSVSLEKLLQQPEGDKSYTGVFNVEKFGKCIAELRSASGLSQQQLGELLEVSPDIVSRWERGVTCPDIDKFVVISRQFNVSVSQLYCAITPQQKHDTVQRVRTNSVVARSLLLLAVCVVALFLAVGLFLIPTTTKPVYTLTFDGVQYNYADGELVSPVAEKKEGYTFVGWVDSNGERVQFPIKVQFEETYTSQYVLNEYTVDYWLNGGYFISSPETIVTIESPTLDLPIPTKDGMEFLGWYTSPDYSGEAVTEVHFCESNIKVYAKWSDVVYTIKYNLNGGILYGTNPSTVTVNEIVELSNPLRNGYTFLGWFDAPNGGNLYTSVGGQGACNVVLYAQWQVSTSVYNISYELNGGELLQDNPTTVVSGDYVKLNEPTKLGHDFVGWCDSADGNGKFYQYLSGVEDDLKLFAIFTPKQYTIRYEYKGSYLGSEYNPNTIECGQTVTLLPVGMYGYTFLGWYTAENGGSKIEVIDESNIGTFTVLYARYSVIKYNIDYELNGGELAQDNPSTVVVDDYVKLHEPTKHGYDFVGWCDSADGNGKFYQYLSGVEDDLKLFAIFTPKQYTIRYEYKGSYLGGEYNPNTIEYGQTVELLPVGMYGYTFLGWYTAENGGSKIEVIDESNVENITVLYARYSIIKYNISYELNGGELAQDNPTQVTTGDYFNLNNPTKHGYDFVGWCDSADGNGKFYQYLSSVEDDLKLFAIFTPKQYTIRYEYKGSYLGSEYNPSTIEYGQTVTLLPVGMHGYTFLGWYTAENGGSKIEVIDESNIGTFTVLYACYSIIKYNITYELNGGELTQENPSTVVVDDYVKLHEPTKHGYDFVGWCDSADGNGKFYQYLSSVENDLKLFAIFTPKQYTIRYEYKGSYLGGEYNPNTIEYGQTVTLLPVGMYGYTFLGWYTAENGGSKVDVIDETNVENITVLYARYSVNIYQINLDGNGGNVETSAGLQPNYTLTVTFGERVTLPNAQRENFSFLGWFDDDGKQVVIIDTLNISDMTLTAMWQDNTVEYAIEYVLNGGTLETPNPTTGSSGTSVALNSPVKNGYLFLGWYDNPYATGSPYTYIPSGRTEDIVLYAIWQEIKVSGSAQYFNYEKGIDTVVITEYTGESGEDVVVNIPAFIEDLPVVELQCRFAGTYRAINIPEGIVSIGNSCFESVTILGDLVIPSTVSYIGDSCFKYGEFNSVRFLESNLQVISASAFERVSVDYPIKLPGNVVSLESKAFFDAKCPGIILPEGLKFINDRALRAQNILYFWRYIYLPSSVVYIASNSVDVWSDGRVFAGFSEEKAESFGNNWAVNTLPYYDVKPNTVTFVDGDNTWTEYGTALELSEPTKNGYKFDGWMDENGNIYGKVFVASQPTTLTAVYRKLGEGDGLSEETARHISSSVTTNNYCKVGDKFHFTIDCQQASYVSLQVVCNSAEYQLNVKGEDGKYSQLSSAVFMYLPDQVLMVEIKDGCYTDIFQLKITVNLV